jgi:peroxiredoxin
MNTPKTAKILWLTLILMALPLTALGAEPEAPDKRKSLARFEVKTLKNKRVSSRDMKGKVTVISFWATWCTPCKQELAALDIIRKKEKKRGLDVLAIATDGPETLSGVRSEARKRKWDLTVATDPDGKVSAKLNPRGTIPYTIFVDRQGRIAHIHAGYKKGDEAGYVKVLEKLLAEK